MMFSSHSARALAAASLCAVALHFAFPRTGLVWLEPLALAGLFAVWFTLPPLAASINGYCTGIVFFTLGFLWFGETAGKLVGSFGFIVSVGPAVIEAFAFAAAAACISYLARTTRPALAPAAAAAAFMLAEIARSSGLLGVPLGEIGVPLIDSPLRPLAATFGVYGLGFAVACIAAYLGATLLDRRRWPSVAIAIAIVAAATTVSWFVWPARTVAAPSLRVAAVQGNIRQAIKATEPAFRLAVSRYSTMTAGLAATHPAFVLWPETVILAVMNANDARSAALRAQFGALARSLHTEIAVGTLDQDPQTQSLRNALYFFGPSGTIVHVFAKRQLVPMTEFLPGPQWLRALPFTDLISHFTPGSGTQIEPALGVGALICWESMFGDLAFDQVRDNARFFAIATDDAWFGTTDGPYQHAQFATVRAVESGRWVLRAASTGISGIIAPDGTWTERTQLETQTTVSGLIGPPQPSLYAMYGPTPVILGIAFVFVLGIVLRRTRVA